MTDEKHQIEATAEATDGKLVKREVIKDDGRALIFYTFPPPNTEEPAGGQTGNV
jgi:hypothetical protein